MKVIDKRPEKNEDWNVGDVVCFRKYDRNFIDFGMIVQEPISSRYSVVSLNTGGDYFSHNRFKEINKMIESCKALWDCVEKVNAHLAVED